MGATAIVPRSATGLEWGSTSNLNRRAAERGRGAGLFQGSGPLGAEPVGRRIARRTRRILAEIQHPVTTSSLEALTAQPRARDRLGRWPAQALPVFQRAIALDPEFAMAYRAQGINYSNLGELDLGKTT